MEGPYSKQGTSIFLTILCMLLKLLLTCLSFFACKLVQLFISIILQYSLNNLLFFRHLGQTVCFLWQNFKLTYQLRKNWDILSGGKIAHPSTSLVQKTWLSSLLVDQKANIIISNWTLVMRSDHLLTLWWKYFLSQAFKQSKSGVSSTCHLTFKSEATSHLAFGGEMERAKWVWLNLLWSADISDLMHSFISALKFVAFSTNTAEDSRKCPISKLNQ